MAAEAGRLVYATSAYQVVLVARTDTNLPTEQRLAYGIVNKDHGVLFATTQSLGHAIDACQSLQTFLDEVIARENQPAAPFGGKAN